MTDAAPATPPAAPPRRRGWLRWTLRVVLALVVLVALLPFALRLGFVRDLIARTAAEALGAPVSIGSASGWWTSGLTLEDVAVESPPGHAGRLLFVPRLHAKADLLALLGGTVKAEIEVDRPQATLVQNAAGRWNADDLGRDRAPKAPKERSTGPGPDLRLTLTGGTLEARRNAPGAAVERVSGIELTAAVAPDESLDAVLAALVEGAGEGGGPARVALTLLTDAEGKGPMKLEVPTLDLARVAGLLESATGLVDVAGLVSLGADGRVDGGGEWQGKIALRGRRLGATRREGSRLALETLEAQGDVTPSAAGYGLAASLTATGLTAAYGSGTDARTWTEREVRLTFDAQRSAAGELRVHRLDLEAGSALTVRAVEPLHLVETSDGRIEVRGKAEIAADLARLGAFSIYEPALAALRKGTLAATLEARGGPGLDLGVGARLTDLELAPSDVAPDGYAERDVALQGALVRDADGGYAIRLQRLQSALAALGGAQPFELRLAPDGAGSLSGPLNLAVSLEQVGRLFGRALGLASGERLGGLLRVQGTAQGTAKDGSFQGSLGITDAVLPASWTAGAAAGPVEGKLALTWGDVRLRAVLADWKGLGVEGGGEAVLGRDGPAFTFTSADARLVLDLPRVRAHVGAAVGIPRTASLSGRALLAARIAPVEGGHELRGTLQASDVRYVREPGAAALEERALTLEHVVKLGADGALEIATGKLRGNGYVADLGGTKRGADGVLALQATLTGDAPALAERVRALIAPELPDLKGEGRVSGRVLARTGPGGSFETAVAEADLDLGTWSASGATLAQGRVTARRESAARPLAAALTGMLNGGSAKVDATLDPKGSRTPFTLTAALSGVDVGTLLGTSRGSRGLAFVLPTLIPLDGATPALSGRLVAHVELSAADASAPLLADTLAGRGEVTLTEGTLARSSLFGALSGGGLGEVGQVLVKLAPEVGRELGNLTRAVSYQQVLTRFEIAERRVLVKESRLTAQAHRLELDGVVGFDERADLKARLWLGSKAGEELKKAVPDQTLPLRVRGTLSKPQVTPDLKASDLLKAAGTGGVLDRAKKEVEDRLKGLLPK
jgi:hypothetical protein